MNFVPIKKLANLGLDFFFPRFCLGCHREGNLICSTCRSSLPYLPPPLCPRCGRPLPLEPCSVCKGIKWDIDGIRSLFYFDGLVREAIHRFKYQNLKGLATPFAELMRDYLKSHPLPIEVIVPVPLHPKRVRQRGYNQSTLLAKKLARFLGLSLIDNSLRRVRHAPPQARAANAEERHANVSGAFTCVDNLVKEKRTLLIDDVCTTGATLDACARALKVAGALSVWGFTLAREI